MRTRIKFLVSPVAVLVVFLAAQANAFAHYIWATVDNGQARFALLESVAEAQTPSLRSM